MIKYNARYFRECLCYIIYLGEDMSDKVKNRIRKLYKDLGYTQKEVYTKMEIGCSAFRENINQPDEDFKVGDLENICDALGISLFDFFNSEEFYSERVSDKPFKVVLEDYFQDQEINKKYEIVGYDHAGDILKCYPEEFQEIKSVLKNLEIEMKDVLAKGGNESKIPKKIREKFVEQGWKTEQEIHGSLHVELRGRSAKNRMQKEIHTINGYLTGYMIDYYKNGIAIDTEWNSKDQTFDRDLMAMRSYYESGLISVGVIITRGSELCTFPAHYGLEKYGASTTWLDQLTERLDCRRAGGCPILAIGITPKAIKDFTAD